MQVTESPLHLIAEKPGIQTITVNRPDGAAILATADGMLCEAQTLIIDSEDMYEICHEELVAVKRKWTELDDREKGLTKPLLNVIEGIRNLFRAPKERLASAEKLRKTAMLDYRESCDRQAADLQRQANEKAAQERHQQQRLAEEAAASARQAHAMGDTSTAVELHEKAEAAQAQASVICAPICQSSAPRLAGGSVSKTWKCELPQNDADKLRLLAFIVANPQYIDLVEVSGSACNAQAKAMKNNLAIPGLRAVAVSSMAVRK
ncbi:MAG: hypothetical protein V4772_07225 [Pseudomonadota bacterium]